MSETTRFELTGCITGNQEMEERSFISKSTGAPGRLLSLFLADETGEVRIICWGDAIDILKETIDSTKVHDRSLTGQT